MKKPSSVPLSLVLAALLFLAVPVARASPESVADLTLQYREEFEHGDLAAAERSARAALSAEQEEVGSDSPQLIPYKRDLATIMAAEGKRDEAESSYRAMLRDVDRSGYEATAATLLFELADLLRDGGKVEEAGTLFARALELERLAGDAILARGSTGGLSAGGINVLGPRMANSYWDVFSRVSGELPNFGRYAYVLVPSRSDAADAFLTALLNMTNSIAGIELPKGRLNLFYFPVGPSKAEPLRRAAIKPGVAQPSIPKSSISAAYDISYASEILTDFCLRSEPKPAECKSTFSTGPYIMILPEPWTRSRGQGDAAVLLDVSGLRPEIQKVVVNAVREVAQAEDPRGFDRMTSIKLTIASALVTAGGVAQEVADQMPKLTKLLRPGGG